MSPLRSRRLERELWLLAAVTALAAGDTITFGFLSVPSFVLICAGVLLMAMARRAPDGRAGPGAWALGCALTASVSFVYAVRLHAPVEAGLSALLVAGVVAVVMLGRDRTPWAALAVCAATLLGMVAVIWQWGVLDVDVFNSVQGASSALLHGHNPYLTTFLTPSPHGSDSFTQVRIHFQYLPGVALLNGPARWLGDVRVMSLLAMGALMFFTVRLALMSPDGRTRAVRAAALCFALPMNVAIVHYALVDVYCVAGLAGWLALRRRHPRWAVASLIVALTIKPTIVVALVPPLLWSRPARREVALALLGAALVALPFALITGFGTFYHDVIGVQVAFGFRYDGLTAGAAWYALTGHIPPVWFGLFAGGVAAVLILRRRPHDIADVMMAAALLSTVSFLLAKWAFMNYYFIPVWLLALAVAGRGVAFEARAQDVALPFAGLALRRWRKPLAVSGSA